LWAEVRKETGRWKSRWRIRDLLGDRRCSQAVLDFLASTDVGKTVLAVGEEGGAGSEASECELWERREREEGREAEAAALGAADELGGRGGAAIVPTHPIVHGIGRRGVEGRRVHFSFVFPLLLPL